MENSYQFPDENWTKALFNSLLFIASAIKNVLFFIWIIIIIINAKYGVCRSKMAELPLDTPETPPYDTPDQKKIS